MDDFLTYLEENPLRRIDGVAKVTGFSRACLTGMAAGGYITAEKRLAMCSDGQRRWTWYIDIHEIQAYAALTLSERFAFKRAHRLGHPS